jgi:hypothetical protein
MASPREREYAMSMSSDQALRRQAERRVKLKTGFFMHAAVFLLVNLGLLVINFVAGGGAWALWPLAGWGLGLAIHGFVVVVKLRGEGLRARLLEQEIARMKQRTPR